MEQLKLSIQIIIAIGIVNVWLLRYNKSTHWRAGQAKNMREEFQAYGLSPSFMMAIGFLKISLSTLLIAGLWWPLVTKPAAGALALLMMGAVSMHFKVKDPAKKSLPAFSLLALCVVVTLL